MPKLWVKDKQHGLAIMETPVIVESLDVIDGSNVAFLDYFAMMDSNRPSYIKEGLVTSAISPALR